MKILQPTYIMRMPSSNKEVKFRPFTVKEEKALLLAMEEKNPDSVVAIVESLIDSCTFGELDPKKIAYYDLEYAFLQIRAKSVGEIVELVGLCDCSPDAQTDFTVSLEDANVEGLKQKDLINVEEIGYFAKMKHPTLKDLTKQSKIDENSSDDEFFKDLAEMIDYVATEDEVYDSMTLDEKVEWVSSLTSKQQRPFAEYISQMPRLTLQGKYKCKMCGKDHSVNVAGLQNFFV